ncbi:hypothetical protein [Pseudarthrobacter sp. AB1]|uniref:hypothetical protein n=1 Tax=Pseudarthrobacter sp. AB1 TaxID=2138309 RepID=UPI00186B79C3|nr:hypothetical protein [Pseudarthrobacter sp. AB1]MBE4716762.1 hypothetical protein [Pseudarthrobacter sp. AB1]
MTTSNPQQTIRHTPGDIMATIARINAGMPAVNGNGQPVNAPEQHTVIHLVTTPEQVLMASIHAENAKLAPEPITDAENANKDTAPDAAVND